MKNKMQNIISFSNFAFVLCKRRYVFSNFRSHFWFSGKIFLYKAILILFIIISNTSFIYAKEILPDFFNTSKANNEYHYTEDQKKEYNNILKPYIKELHKKIKNNWHPELSAATRRTVVILKIKKDGTLLSYIIKTSSLNKEFDNSAIKAINMSAPFSPLPENFDQDFVNIEYTFNDRVFRIKDKPRGSLIQRL